MFIIHDNKHCLSQTRKLRKSHLALLLQKTRKVLPLDSVVPGVLKTLPN